MPEVADPITEFINTLPPLDDAPDEFPETVEEADALEGDALGGDADEGADADSGAPRDSGGDDPSSSVGDDADPFGADADPAAYQHAQFGKQMLDALSNDPETAINAILAQMEMERPGFTEALLNSYQPPMALPEDYEAQSEFESWAMPMMKNVQALPNMVETSVQSHFGRVVTGMADVVDMAHIQTLVAREETKALAQALGMDMPAVDTTAVLTELRKGLTYEAAVQKVVGAAYGKAVDKHKQDTKARPRTPGGSSSGFALPSPNAQGIVDMKEIFRNL